MKKRYPILGGLLALVGFGAYQLNNNATPKTPEYVAPSTKFVVPNEDSQKPNEPPKFDVVTVTPGEPEVATIPPKKPSKEVKVKEEKPSIPTKEAIKEEKPSATIPAQSKVKAPVMKEKYPVKTKMVAKHQMTIRQPFCVRRDGTVILLR